MATEKPNRQQLLNAMHQLASLATADDLSEDANARLAKVTELLEKAARISKERLAASADVTLVKDLERIYQRVLDEASGVAFAYPQDVFTSVEIAAIAWANSTGNLDHDALTQRRLEELELTADEVLEKGGLREAKGTAKHAAIMMAEHTFGIPERTSYDRQKRNVSQISQHPNPVTEVLIDQHEAILRTALAIEATSGLSADEAFEEAKKLREAGLQSLLRRRRG